MSQKVSSSSILSNDESFNVYKAETFIHERQGKMPNGVSVKITKYEENGPHLVFMSINTQKGNFSGCVNLAQPYDVVAKEMNGTYANICRIAQGALNA